MLVGSATLSPAWSVSTAHHYLAGYYYRGHAGYKNQVGRHESLTGVIPPELGDLDRLTHLSLWENELTGEIPPRTWGPQKCCLRSILSHNLLSGEIPPELGDLSLLRTPLPVLKSVKRRDSGRIGRSGGAV